MPPSINTSATTPEAEELRHHAEQLRDVWLVLAEIRAEQEALCKVIHDQLPDVPSMSAARTLLRLSLPELAVRLDCAVAMEIQEVYVHLEDLAACAESSAQVTRHVLATAARRAGGGHS